MLAVRVAELDGLLGPCRRKGRRWAAGKEEEVWADWAALLGWAGLLKGLGFLFPILFLFPISNQTQPI